MKTIFVTMSKGGLIRNFLHTGVIEKILQEGCRVVLLTPQYQDKEIFKPFMHENLVLEPLHRSKIRFGTLIGEFSKGAVFNRTVNYLWRFRLLGVAPSRLYYLPRILFLSWLRWIPGFKTCIRWIDMIINPQKEHDYLFEKYKPDLIFSTSCNGYVDSGVIKGAKRFGVKTVGMLQSWDNVSKILTNTKMDYLFVWSPFMKHQAMTLQGFKESEIVVTGVPQFDHYHKKEKLLSREDFCKKFNFDPQKKIVLYGSSGGGPDLEQESDYPEIIHGFLEQGLLRDVQVIARPHIGYKNDADKFDCLATYDGFAVDRTDTQSPKFTDHWDPSVEHLNHLYNSLYHADVCINIASTLTLDAAVCGTPVINIRFDRNEVDNYNDSLRRLHDTGYIRAVMAIGATWIVNSKDEFLVALKAVLEKNMQKDLNRLINEFIYKNDGRSAERIADALVKIVSNEKITS